MNSVELAEKLMEILEYFMDGYYLSGNGREEITKIIIKTIEESKSK